MEKNSSCCSNELISIVIPIYKVEQYLRRCIDSVICQTYKNIEIILIDDGSPDNCGKLCDEIKKKDNRIKVIHKSNGGLSDARNCGINIATGKYITFIDSDDYVTEDYIEYMYRLLSQEKAEIAVCKLRKTINDNESCAIKDNISLCMNKYEAMREMLYADKYSVAAPAKLYLKELFIDVNFPIGKFSEDIFTTYKVFDKANKIVYGNKICYFYYCRKNSLITSSFSMKKLDVVEGLEQFKRDIPIEEYGLKKAYASQMIECIMTILQSAPTYKQIMEIELWNKVKIYRNITICDSNASNRVRGYAILSYLGPILTVKILRVYYKIKWNL